MENAIFSFNLCVIFLEIPLAVVPMYYGYHAIDVKVHCEGYLEYWVVVLGYFMALTMLVQFNQLLFYPSFKRQGGVGKCYTFG
jgi:hypothetical protein